MTKLEKELGATLLDRCRTGSRISRQGLDLLQNMTEVLEAVDRLRQAAGQQSVRRRDLRIGTSRFACEHDTAAERDVKIYLRPEDVLARPIAPGDANVFDGAIDKIEFLGSYCLVRVQAEAMGAQPITVYLSLNFLAEQGLEVGSRLPLKVLPERMRFF